MDIAPLKRGVQLLNIAKQDYIKSASSYRNAREHLGHRYKNPGTLWQYQIEEAQQEASMMDGYINDIEKRITELTNELNSEVHLITQAKHGLDMPFIRVEGGCYQMGSSDTTPGHKVCVDGFWIGNMKSPRPSGPPS